MWTQRLRGGAPLCTSVQLDCRLSNWHALCPAKGLNSDSRNTRGGVCTSIVGRGDYLFRQGEGLKYLYVVHSGSLKSYFSTADDAHHIVRFHLPGDLVGLDALADHSHATSAQALETTSLCQFAFALSPDDSRISIALYCHILKLAGLEMISNHKHAVILAQRDASERLALFLLHLSGRYHKRGLSECDFNLSMSRREIASYLALTVETVSRTFTHFHENGLLKVDHRRICVTSIDKLRELVAPERQSMLQ